MTIDHEQRVTELMIADAMKIAHAEGRKAGIEEAAKIAEMTPMPRFGTNARINGQHEAKTKIVAAIRALSAAKVMPFTKREALADKGETTFK